LPPETAAALKTLKTTNIIVVGGSAAVSDALISTLQTTDKFSVSRVAGANRFATSLAIDSVAGNMNVGTAGGQTAAGPSSATTNGVTLASTAVVAGGTVSGTLANPTTVSTLTVTGPGATTETLTVNQTTGDFSFVVPVTQTTGSFNLVFTTTPTNGGAATQGTTVLTVNPATGTAYSGQKFAIVTDGLDANLVDTLGSSPVAFADHFPILLVNGATGTLSAAQLALLKTDGISSDVLVVGGSAAVGAALYTQLAANGQTPVNVAGPDHSATSQALADFAIDNLGFSTTTFDIASGAPGHLIDSLAGGPYGGVQAPPAPTLITTDVTNVGSVGAFATEHAGTESSATVFGGTAAVAASILTTVTADAQTAAPLTAGSATLTTTSGPVGGTLSGIITTPQLVKSVTVSGCGFSNSPESFNTTTGAFTLTIPSTTVGTCTLTFTSTLDSGATVVSTATVTVTAPASPVPVSGPTTGLGIPPTNLAAPVLTSANIVNNNFLGLGQSEVQFIFDTNVNPQKVADLTLQGYRVGRVSAAPLSINTDATNSDAIDAFFANTVDVKSYTIAVAQNTSDSVPSGGAVSGAVNPASGLPNPLGSVLLGGSTGATSATVDTTAPDLVSAQLNPSNNSQIVYTFDKPVESASANKFFGYTAAGAPATHGTSLSGFTAGSELVYVNFGPANTGAASAFVRFATGTGAAQGQAGGAEGTSPVGSAGGQAKPDLTAVTPVAGTTNEYLYTFDQNVAALTPGDYFVVLNNATQYPGTGASNTSSNTVLVTFPDPPLNQANAANIVAGAVVEGAAKNVPGGKGNSIGAVPLTGVLTNGGPTDGPALQALTINTNTQTATYTFNQAPVVKDADEFFVLDSTGAATRGATAVANTNNVTVTFTSNIAGDIAGGVDNGTGFGQEDGPSATAVTNSEGTPNAPGDVIATVTS
ncbi:MAG: beta strand repeat-containing protein, partial [Acidimicrobiales bacterium]